MDLAFNLLLTLLLELPIVAFFFRRRKRSNAILVSLLVNVVTWPLINIIRLNTSWDANYVQIGVVIAEGLAYWFFFQCGWKKGFIMSIIANLVSFIVTKYVYISPDFFQKKQELIIQST